MQPSTKYYLISGFLRVPGHHPCNHQPNTKLSVVTQGYWDITHSTLNQILPHQWLPKGTRTLSIQPSTKYYLISGYIRVPGHHPCNPQPNTTSSVVTQGYQDTTRATLNQILPHQWLPEGYQYTTHATLNQILTHQWLPKGTRALPMQPSTKYYLISGYQRVPGHHPCNPQPNTTSSVVNQGYQYTILATLNQILPHQWLPKGTRTLPIQPSTKYYLISGYPRVPGHYPFNPQPNTTSSVVT